jgi:hypothetical protein
MQARLEAMNCFAHSGVQRSLVRMRNRYLLEAANLLTPPDQFLPWQRAVALSNAIKKFDRHVRPRLGMPGFAELSPSEAALRNAFFYCSKVPKNPHSLNKFLGKQ